MVKKVCWVDLYDLELPVNVFFPVILRIIIFPIFFIFVNFPLCVIVASIDRTSIFILQYREDLLGSKCNLHFSLIKTYSYEPATAQPFSSHLLFNY